MKQGKGMNLERVENTTEDIFSHFGYYNQDTHWPIVMLLSDISQSLAVIADALTAQRKIGEEDTDDGK